MIFLKKIKEENENKKKEEEDEKNRKIEENRKSKIFKLEKNYWCEKVLTPFACLTEARNEYLTILKKMNQMSSLPTMFLSYDIFERGYKKKM